MAKNKQVWVSPDKDNGGWRVHTPGSKKDIKHTDTKTDAIKTAEKIAKNNGGETKIQNKDGIIGGGNSYGNDSCPPVDKK